MVLFFRKNKLLIFLSLLILCLYFFFFKKNTEAGKAGSNLEQMQGEVGNIDNKIEDFIMKNPEVVIKSLENMHEKNINQKAQSVIEQRRDELQDTTKSPFAGSLDAAETIVMFYDYNCVYCKGLNDTLNSLMEKNKDVKVVYKLLPLFGESSDYAATVALAVYYSNPDKFLAFHNFLMKKSDLITKESVEQQIKDMGISYSVIEEHMDKKDIQDEISRSKSIAKDIYSNEVAPMLIIGDKLLRGAVPLEKIEQELSSKKLESKNQ